MQTRAKFFLIIFLFLSASLYAYPAYNVGSGIATYLIAPTSTELREKFNNVSNDDANDAYKYLAAAPLSIQSIRIYGQFELFLTRRNALFLSYAYSDELQLKDISYEDDDDFAFLTSNTNSHHIDLGYVHMIPISRYLELRAGLFAATAFQFQTIDLTTNNSTQANWKDEMFPAIGGGVTVGANLVLSRRFRLGAHVNATALWRLNYMEGIIPDMGNIAISSEDMDNHLSEVHRLFETSSIRLLVSYLIGPLD